MGGRGYTSAASRQPNAKVSSSTKSVLGGTAWKNETLGEFADRMIRLDSWRIETQGVQRVIDSHKTELRQAEGRLSTYLGRQSKVEGYAKTINDRDIQRETQQVWAERAIIEKLTGKL